MGYGYGAGQKISYEDADRMGSGLFEFVIEGLKEKLDTDVFEVEDD